MHRREMSPYSFDLCQGNLTGCISHSSVISGYLLKSMNNTGFTPAEYAESIGKNQARKAGRRRSGVTNGVGATPIHAAPDTSSVKDSEPILGSQSLACSNGTIGHATTS